MADPLRGAVAIAGVGEAGIGEAPPGATPLDLIGEAAAVALADAGLRTGDVDGLFTASAYYGMPNLNVGEYLGVRPRFSDSTNLGGASFLSHVGHAGASTAVGAASMPRQTSSLGENIGATATVFPE